MTPTKSHPKLDAAVARIYDHFHPDRVSQPRSLADIEAEEASLSVGHERRVKLSSFLTFLEDATAQERAEIRARLDAIEQPWSQLADSPLAVSEAEENEFAEDHGKLSLREVRRRILDPAWLSGGEDVVKSVALLIGWDWRYIDMPAIRRILRDAQLADSRAVFSTIGKAFTKNQRYGGRGMRGQHWLTRILMQLTYGDRRSFSDDNYALEIFDALNKAVVESRIHPDAPQVQVLGDWKKYLQHLRRLGLRRATGDIDNSVVTPERKER